MDLADCMKKPVSPTCLQAIPDDFLYEALPFVTIMQQVGIMPVEGVVFWQQEQANGIFPDLRNSQAASPQVIKWVYS